MSLQITALLDALAASQGDKLVREGVASWLGGAAAPKAKKVKAAAKKAVSEDASDEEKPKKPANAWIRYVEHVCGPKGAPTEAYEAWVAEHPDVKGNKKIKFASELKQENPEDYAAFAAEHKVDFITAMKKLGFA